VGTIGFIAASGQLTLTGSKANTNQFIIARGGDPVWVFFHYPSQNVLAKVNHEKFRSLPSSLVCRHLKLFGTIKLRYSSFFRSPGCALQLTNMYGDTFLDDFKKIPAYGPDSFVVVLHPLLCLFRRYPKPFHSHHPIFLKKVWHQKVHVILYVSMGIAFWVVLIWKSGRRAMDDSPFLIVYGMDLISSIFSGSLFVETNTDPKIRSSARVCFMMIKTV